MAGNDAHEGPQRDRSFADKGREDLGDRAAKKRMGGVGCLAKTGK